MKLIVLFGALWGATTLALAPALAADTCRREDGCDEAPACEVIQSVADLDVPQVRLVGDFLLNGATPFWFPGNTGTFELRHPSLGRVVLGQLHDGDYDVMVIPGVYDIVYRHDAGLFAPENTEAVIAESVEILDGQRLDIPISAVLVTGTFTLNGAPTPDSAYERGELALLDRETGALTPLGSTGDHSYSAFVIPGDYDIVYRNLIGGTLVPKNARVTLLEDVHVAGGTLDIDIPAVARTGSFRIGGALAPQSVYENGLVFLRDEDGNVTEVGATRDRTYALKLVPGVYDAVYSHLIGHTIVPLNTWATVVSDAAMLTAGSRDIDVPVAAIAGDFTIDGNNFPQSNYNRARIWLEGAEPWDTFELGVANEQSYSARIVPGTYDIHYQGLTTTGLVPANSWAVLERGRVITALRSVRRVDIAVTSGWLDTEVTLWGEAPPQSVYEQGKIRARPVDGGAAVELYRTHNAPESVRVLAGDYRVSYDHMIGSTHVPRNDHAIIGLATAELLWPATALLDMHSGPLSGVYTHGDLEFPADPATHADFGLRDVVTGDVVPLGPSHEGAYDVLLLSGTYEIFYDYVAGGGIPANRGATLGCITFAPVDPN